MIEDIHCDFPRALNLNNGTQNNAHTIVVFKTFLSNTGMRARLLFFAAFV
jgi:hypothetical protein